MEASELGPELNASVTMVHGLVEQGSLIEARA